MIDTMERYKKLATPPADALKKIEGGKLNGKTDINPQWKIEAMTEVFGTVGIGWKFEVVKSETIPVADGQILIFMMVAVQVFDKTGEGKWSDPVYGCGGDFIVEKNKNGLVPNDEAWKMCLTDALGNALKCLGVAADVYRGMFEGKYTRMAAAYSAPKTTGVASTGKSTTQANPTDYVRHDGGKLAVRSLKKGCENTWLVVSDMTMAQMKWAYNCEKYASVKAEIGLLGAAKFGGKEWGAEVGNG